jgi:hypothetical protein
LQFLRKSLHLKQKPFSHDPEHVAVPYSSELSLYGPLSPVNTYQADQRRHPQVVDMSTNKLEGE